MSVINRLSKLIFIVALCFTNQLYGQLVTINIPVSYDSYTDSKGDTLNFGSDTTMHTGVFTNGGTGYYNRAFMYFDLSSIPAGTTVDNAEIRAVMSSGSTWSQDWDVKRVTETWYEDSITHTNMPTISDGADYGYWSYSAIGSDTVTFAVGAILRDIHWGMKENFGFVIESLDETDTTGNNLTLYSGECVDTVLRPFLRVEYYFPIELDVVTIVHESDSAAADGSITVSPIYGSENYTYSWVNSSGTVLSTDSILDSLSYGWYGLHITGTEDDELYQAFLVGTDCRSVDIDFRSSSDYADFATTSELPWGGIDKPNVNYGNYAHFLTLDWKYGGTWGKSYSYLDLQLWIDDRFTIEKSDLTLYGRNHYISAWTTNESELIKVTEPWVEDAITYNNSPATTESLLVFIDSTSTSTQNRTVDISDFCDSWKTDNNANYGMRLQLDTFANTFITKQHYYSPNNGSTAIRPLVEFTVNLEYNNTPLTCNPELRSHKSLQSGWSSSYATASNGEVKFSFTENYAVDTALYLAINIYDEDLDEVASCSSGGFTTTGMTAFKYDYGYNEYTLDLTGISAITTGNFYFMEVINSKGDKKYLKFYYED
ncbi:MAG: DNRLRE domain-containing protein [Crocinitomicaceae bacterium]|nr:DNRLRE domain-containing protein [Crocinitomicaceae bacterium]